MRATAALFTLTFLLLGQISAVVCPMEIGDGSASMHTHASSVPPDEGEPGSHSTDHGAHGDGEACLVLMSCGTMAIGVSASSTERSPHGNAFAHTAAAKRLSSSTPEHELPPPRRV